MKLKVNIDKVAYLFFPWLQLILWSMITLLIAIWVIAHIVMGSIGWFGAIIGCGLFGYFAYLHKGLVNELKEEYRRYNQENA